MPPGNILGGSLEEPTLLTQMEQFLSLWHPEPVGDLGFYSGLEPRGTRPKGRHRDH